MQCTLCQASKASDNLLNMALGKKMQRHSTKHILMQDGYTDNQAINAMDMESQTESSGVKDWAQSDQTEQAKSDILLY